MLFNSYAFIFAFLPVTLAGFFLLGLRSRNLALGWIVVASVAFYAWWRPINVLIIAPSILVNFALARWLLHLTADKARAGLARLVLLLGIGFNVVFLGYFKYVDFLATAANDVIGTNFVLTQVVLPLGISFITFQKIAFLIDVYGRRVSSFSLGDYCLFVLFFPQLIAGPIVHYGEMMPQFQQARCRWDKENIAVGLSLFVFGLFKKVILADGISEQVSPIYEMATTGSEITLLPAWIAAIGFTLQIYFDFSGYSDMALGLARFFGVRLPANFDSPLKATSIIDFWLRWHMTLTRFLTAYLYNPLALWLTRPHGERAARTRKTRAQRRCLFSATGRAGAAHHVRVRTVARGGLSLHPVGAAAWRLSVGQPRVAAFWAKELAEQGNPCEVHAADRVGAHLPVGCCQHGSLSIRKCGRRQRTVAGHGRRERHQPAATDPRGALAIEGLAAVLCCCFYRNVSAGIFACDSLARRLASDRAPGPEYAATDGAL